MLAFGKARAFDEVENPYRVITKLRAGFAGGFEVFAFLLRVLGQVRLGVALHERKAQCPPRQTDHRHPYQLLLEEELQRLNPAI